MKFKSILLTAGLAVTLGAAALAGSLSSNEVKAAKATGVSGTTWIDLTECTKWEADNANFAVYYWNKEANGWSSFAVESTEFEDIYSVSYSLTFVPTSMKVARLNPAGQEPSWSYDWGGGEDETFFEFGVIGVNDYNNSWAGALTALKNGETRLSVLDHYKRNSDKQSEHYSDSVVLSENDEFVIEFNGESYTSYSTHATLTSAFSLVNGKIHVNTGSTYAMYFNTDEGSRSLYITTPALAEADKWAQEFLGADCAATKTGWSTSAGKFASLGDGAKALLASEPHVAHDAQTTTWLAKAAQRYDYIIERFGINPYNDFIGRINSQHIVPHQGAIINSITNSNSATTIVIIITVVATLSVVGFVVFKKKHN